MAVDYSDMELAFDFASSGYEFEHASWINKESGEIYYISDARRMFFRTTATKVKPI